MTITVTTEGQVEFTDAIAQRLKRVHLFVDQGELQGHGYTPVNINPELWELGTYPTITWEFEAGEPVQVLGYYVTKEDGTILYTELFQRTKEDDFIIKNNGDRISVNINLRFLPITQ